MNKDLFIKAQEADLKLGESIEWKNLALKELESWHERLADIEGDIIN